jgi:hypothetical protein
MHLTFGPRLRIIPFMLRVGRIRSLIAFCLAALLGALGTGLPSHHHATDDSFGDSHPVIEAEHHSHGTVLVEQDHRVQSTPLNVVMPASVPTEVPTPALRIVPQADPQWLPARERSPPQTSPRAPPSSL